MESRTIKPDGIGTVLFERSRRAKRLNISIRPFREIRVAVPVGVPFKKAEMFFFSKREWVIRHLDRIRKAEADIKTRRKAEPKIDGKRHGKSWSNPSVPIMMRHNSGKKLGKCVNEGRCLETSR
ncbi:DUF45 domain-containing protein [bacterium]|nr:DUF45 domain-containing protein [candidate division CSSED10-310 bacterium]